MMKQFLDLKAKHPDAVMLFRCGDFYETYSTDAIVAAEILGITLTKRANGKGKTIEMAGFPHHALDTYLPKLVRAGKRVAICDQLEDPKMTKKLVKRGITELVTPGVSINDNVLNYKENNFLAAVHFGKASCGVAFLDISTGEFLTAEGPFDYIDKLLNNFAPKEILFERGKRLMFEGNFGSKFLINDYCVKAEKPFCHAGVVGFEGQLMTYIPHKSPCYRCVFEEEPKAGDVPLPKEVGVISAACGVTGSLQAMEAIKFLLSKGELLCGYMLIYNALNASFRKIKLPKQNPNCKACAKQA